MSKAKKILFVVLIVGNLVLTGLIVRACFAESSDMAGTAPKLIGEVPRTAQDDAQDSEKSEAHSNEEMATDAESGKEAIARVASGKTTAMNDLLSDALEVADSASANEVADNNATGSADEALADRLASASVEHAANDVPSRSNDAAEMANSGGGSPQATSSASNFETKENGTVGDFVWFLEGRNKKSRPVGVKTITDPNALGGGWKYVIVIDPENKRNEAAVEYGHAELSFMGWMADVNLHRHRLHMPGFDTPADLTSEPVTMINGKWKDGVLWAKGKGKNEVRLTDFYEQDGQQFATGSYVTFDAIPAYIALVRP